MMKEDGGIEESVIKNTHLYTNKYLKQNLLTNNFYLVKKTIVDIIHFCHNVTKCKNKTSIYAQQYINV